MIKSGQAWAGTFVTLDATGALAAGSPSGVLYVDGVANAATVTITGSNPYKWAVTLPTLTAGQRVDMYITGTIATIATAGIVASEQADTSLATDTSSIAGDIWSYKTRTLTHPSVSAEEPEGSNTLILYRDADIAIELSDLAIPAGAKKYIFTIKDNLDSGDDQAVLQASYAIDGSEVETNTLVYINSAAAPVLTNPVTFTLTDTNITIDLTAEAAALLPRYERGYLNWDLKLVTDASVTIVLQGLAQIIGTSTRAIE